MALAGAALGWLGAVLDAHGDVVAPPVGQLLSVGIQRAALPLAVGLLLAALLATRSEGGLERYSRAAQAGEGGVFSPEAFLMTLAHLGFAFAVARDLLGVLLLPLRLPFPVPESEGMSATSETPRTKEESVIPARQSSALARFMNELDARIEVVVGWGLLGALVAAVIRAAVPDGALLGPTWASVLAALAFSVSVPLHAVAASQLAFALAEKGLGNAGALLIAIVAPLAVRPDGLRPALLLGGASLACVALADHLPKQLVTVEPTLAWGAAALLGVLVLRRAYQTGFRGFLRPLVHAD
jgi:hypothetical protein